MQLFYRTKGDPTLPPLIILHGLWGASDNWLQVADQLCHHYYVILPDLRNHGYSPHCKAMDYESMSQDVSRLIKELALPQKPCVAGHSMGGKVLMTLLFKEPQLIEKAAILDIAPISYPLTENSFHQILMNFMLHFSLSDYSKRAAIHSRIRETFSSEMLCQILFKNINKNNCGYTWRVNIQAIHKNIVSLLAWPPELFIQNTETPILFIRGEQSNYITDHEHKTILHLFPTAQIETIANASHFMHIDQPNILAQMLLHFFQDLNS